MKYHAACLFMEAHISLKLWMKKLAAWYGRFCQNGKVYIVSTLIMIIWKYWNKGYRLSYIEELSVKTASLFIYFDEFYGSTFSNTDLKREFIYNP